MTLLFALLDLSLPVEAELVVVVNQESQIEQLSHEEVVNIFMGRYRQLKDGSTALPLDIKGDSTERQVFYRKLLDKSLAEINAYWARLIFSGRTSPPIGLDSWREVLEKLARDPTAIGYIERSALTKQVKVVYTLSE